MIERAKLTVGKLSAALIWIRPRWRAANAPMVALGGAPVPDPTRRRRWPSEPFKSRVRDYACMTRPAHTAPECSTRGLVVRGACISSTLART